MEPIRALLESGFRVTHLGHERVFLEGAGERHVYTGWWTGGATKWITKKPLDGTIRMMDGVHRDAHGREVLVYHEGDDDFDSW